MRPAQNMVVLKRRPAARNRSRLPSTPSTGKKLPARLRATTPF